MPIVNSPVNIDYGTNYLSEFNGTDTEMYHMDQMIESNSSTMTDADESIFKEFANKASDYAKKVASKQTYDFKTKNKSFLNLYNDLYKLGIKNNKFFLRIFDTDLIGVDAYSPVLPKETQLKIYLECLINPWYYLREVCRIPTDGTPIEVGGGVPYRIDRNDVATWYLFLNGIDHYKSKPRQRGKTQDCVAKFNYAYLFGNMSSTSLFFNKSPEYAIENLYRLKCQRELLPAWLQMRDIVTSDGKSNKGIENTRKIRNPVTNNTIVTMGKATSKESAMKLGRGATAALQYYDEFDFIPFQNEIINAASFAYVTAAKNSRDNGGLYGRILSSTPGDLDSRDGKSASKMVERMLVWDDSMLDMPIDELKAIVNSPAYSNFVYVEHSWQQLKLSMKWYEEQCGIVDYDMEVILREVWLKRIHGSSMSPFKRADLMYLLNNIRQPIKKVDYSKNLCPIVFYEHISLNKPYILSVDPAEGLGEDNTSFTLINVFTQMPAAEFKSPYISQRELFELMIQFLDEYCPKSMIVVENNKGRELLNYLIESRYKYQLYYDDGKLGGKVIETNDPMAHLKKRAMERRAYGIWTGRTNRHQFFGILENIMEERKELLSTEYLVDDVCGLIRKPASGRIEAGDGKHDDNIMSYLIGLFVYLFAPAEKLEEYGIKRGASEDISDYDEHGNMTEEATMNHLIGMMDSLPEEMRELIKQAKSAMDPVKESQSYHKELMRHKGDRSAEREIEYGLRNGPTITPTNHPVDEAFWQNYDNQVWERNYEFNDTNGQSFDMDDFL